LQVQGLLSNDHGGKKSIVILCWSRDVPSLPATAAFTSAGAALPYLAYVLAICAGPDRMNGFGVVWSAQTSIGEDRYYAGLEYGGGIA